MTREARFGALGDALRTAREVAGLTQMEAAAKIGTTATQLYRYESGNREAPLSFIKKAEEAYEQLIAPRVAGSVSRETVRSGNPTKRSDDHHRRVLLDAAHRLSALAAELIQEANSHDVAK